MQPINRRALQYLFQDVKSFLPVGIFIAGYTYYHTKHTQLRRDLFKNKSNLFGGLKNPQY
jgi:hypothetical protein